MTIANIDTVDKAAASSSSSSLFPGRSSQYAILSSLLYNDPEMPALPSVYLFGGPSTCKTSLVSHLLKDRGNTGGAAAAAAIVCIVQCLSILNERSMYDKILNGFYTSMHASETTEKRVNESYSCDYFQDMVLKLSTLMESNTNKYYLVLDRVDELLHPSSSSSSVSFLTCLSPLIQLASYAPVFRGRLSVLLICRLCPDRFYARLCLASRPTLVIHFPSYDRGTLKQILGLYRPPLGIPLYSSSVSSLSSSDLETIHDNFIDLILNVYAPVAPCLSELLKISIHLFPAYVRPILDASLPFHDTNRLYKAIAPALKSNPIQRLECPTLLSPSLKYLLIAAYLASYNPAKMDSRLFGGDSSQLPFRSRKKLKAPKMTTSWIGPKNFPFERLLAIYYHISDEDASAGSQATIYHQVSLLLDLGLIQRLGPRERLDELKLRARVNFDTVERLSIELSFDLYCYLMEGQSTN